jgi:phosphatidylserine/phosphatidylglycerophosphate/cardiolipin synthase-like enzyme
VKPSYFVYTLPDPDSLGTEKMNKYVGDSPELAQERAKLRRWSEQRSEDIRRYKEMTDRLFSHGIERELDQKVLRIMTPYDDDTFSEFTSQFRTLLRRGYEIRLVTRHTREGWQWRRLRDNLLGELDENRDNITIRTYSRYKEYERITGQTNDRDLEEFGIHAKLQTIGNADEGIALLGSANFMENSYNWNPECGIYTENANFVDSAIGYFDHVWDLASGDEIDLEKLQKTTKRSFHPSYYT